MVTISPGANYFEAASIIGAMGWIKAVDYIPMPQNWAGWVHAAKKYIIRAAAEN